MPLGPGLGQDPHAYAATLVSTLLSCQESRTALQQQHESASEALIQACSMQQAVETEVLRAQRQQIAAGLALQQQQKPADDSKQLDSAPAPAISATAVRRISDAAKDFKAAASAASPSAAEVAAAADALSSFKSQLESVRLNHHLAENLVQEISSRKQHDMKAASLSWDLAALGDYLLFLLTWAGFQSHPELHELVKQPADLKALCNATQSLRPTVALVILSRVSDKA